MISFFRKDLLLYWRNRKEIIISLVTPLIIIVVLGFALPGWVENPAKTLEMQIALVQLDDEQAAQEQFIQSLASRDEQQRQAAMQGAESIQPSQWLQQLLSSKELSEYIGLQSMDYEEATEQLQNEGIIAAIVIPEGFTLATLNKMLLNDGHGANLRIITEEASFKVNVLSNIISNFLDTLNYQAVIGQLLDSNGAAAIQEINKLAESNTIGGREVVEGVRVVTSFQYYAIAVSIIFALLISTTIAAKAVSEKRERIFNRIVLSNSKPIHYLLGKFSSTFILSLLQLAIILIVSHFILDIFPNLSLTFWLGLSAVFVILALCIGSLAAFFTALVFRIKEDLANGLTLISIIIAGTIGGNFVPIYALPPWLREAGEWTPNGIALNVLLQWLQTETATDLIMPLVALTGYIVVVLCAALWIFPRKGHSA